MILTKLPEIKRYDQAAKEIGDFIVKCVRDVNATGVVIGLSGGIDSSLVACIAKDALDNAGLALEVYFIPSNESHDNDYYYAAKLATRLNINLTTIDINAALMCLVGVMGMVDNNYTYNKGNMISRMRANVLHTRAAVSNKIVLGTGNKDEDFGIGYYTLFGDGAVHCSPIGNLSKRLVYKLATWHNLDEWVNREPTAGLAKGQTDLGDLGYGYDFVELALETDKYNRLEYMEYWMDSKIIDQLFDCFKPYIGIKFNNLKDACNDVLNRHKMAIKKQEILSPKCAEITFV